MGRVRPGARRSQFSIWDGGAARGDTILGDEVIEIAEGEVDALGGLEVLRILKEFRGEILFDRLILVEASMARAERGAADRKAAAGTVLKLVQTRGDRIADIGVSGFGSHTLILFQK